MSHAGFWSAGYDRAPALTSLRHSLGAYCQRRAQARAVTVVAAEGTKHTELLLLDELPSAQLNKVRPRHATVTVSAKQLRPTSRVTGLLFAHVARWTLQVRCLMVHASACASCAHGLACCKRTSFWRLFLFACGVLTCFLLQRSPRASVTRCANRNQAGKA